MDIFNIGFDKQKDIEIIKCLGEELSVIFEQGSFKKIENSYSQGIGLRVIHNGKIGFSFSNDLSDDRLIKRALESAKFGEKACFTFAKSNNNLNNNTLYYSEVEGLKTNTIIDIGQYIINKIKEYNSNIKVDTEITKEIHQVYLKTSEGFFHNYKKSFFSIGISGIIAKDDQLLSIYSSKVRLRPFIDDYNIDRLIFDILDKFSLASKNYNIKTGNYKVIFTPRAFRVLITILTSGLNGKSIQKGISPLSNKLNQKLISKDITIVDDGTIRDGLASAPFDGEGTKTKRNILFNKGVLNGFIYDLQTAGLLNKSSTGNGLRGYSSTPYPGFRNIVLEPGSDSYEALLSSVDEGLLVDQFIGAGQSNVLAGEFSMNLDLAFKIENGKILGRVKDVMMSGNVFKALTKVLAIGDKLYREASGFYPYALLDKVSISSKG